MLAEVTVKVTFREEGKDIEAMYSLPIYSNSKTQVVVNNCYQAILLGIPK